MRVAIVHDDLVQWGGAERVLSGLSEIYPDAPIYTSVFDGTNITLLRNFGTKKIITSFLQKIPGWKSLYKTLLPFYPLAFEQFDFSGFDLVLSHTTRFAKSIITKPETLHICYCHTPPRFLWHFSGEKNYGLGEILLTGLRLYDQVSAHRVDHFIAGSENAKRRIKKVYGMESKVVYPFVDLARFAGVESFEGEYFLVIARLNKYKKVNLAIEACLKLGVPLKIIGTGTELEKLKRLPRRYAPLREPEGSSEPRTARNDITFLRDINNTMTVQTLAGCKALIVPGIEDFGLTSLEAQALGKPVVAFRKGGALETVTDNKTGIFFDEQTVDSLKNALLKLDSAKINPQDCIKNAGNFSKENFIKNFKQTVAFLL